MGVGKSLDALEAMVTLLALVFVKWHGLPETLLKTQVRLKLSAIRTSASSFKIRTEN